MARWHCYLAGLVALAALGSGCATSRLANPFGSTSSKSSTAQLAKKSAKDGQASEGGSLKPVNKSAALAAAKDARSAETDDAGAALAKSAKDDGHDPETAAYINEQLRDATPEERTTLKANLTGLQPGQVRQILVTHRRAINARRQQELIAQRNDNSLPPGTIQPASGESTAGTGRVITADASQNAPQAGANNNLPVGHSSAYRADGTLQNTADTGYASVTPRPTAAGRGPPAVGQSAANSQNVAHAAATVTAGTPRDAGVRPASVAIGVPMNAGAQTAGASPGDGSTKDLLARLISVAESEAYSAQPGETDAEKQAFEKKQVDLRLLYLIAGQHERALQAIPGLDPAVQEFWQQTFWGVTNYFDVGSIPSPTERAAQTVTQMTNAVLRLQEKANLELRNVTFCHKISNFGNFEKYPREEFSPGQEVLLYAEVANIHSEPIPDGKFRTSLKSTIEIFHHGSQGELIERIDLPETIDICRTHRRDYFHSYQYTIPTKLTLGPHLMKLTVEDQLSRRVATYTLNFTVK